VRGQPTGVVDLAAGNHETHEHGGYRLG
jgi:hypothetical protein